jgi:hypothetical protein
VARTLQQPEFFRGMKKAVQQLLQILISFARPESVGYIIA